MYADHVLRFESQTGRIDDIEGFLQSDGVHKICSRVRPRIGDRDSCVQSAELLKALVESAGDLSSTPTVPSHSIPDLPDEIHQASAVVQHDRMSKAMCHVVHSFA